MGDGCGHQELCAGCSLDHAIELIGLTRGNTSRDLNRSVYLAAGLFGIHYKEMHRLMKLAHLQCVWCAASKASKELKWPEPTGFVYFAQSDDGKRIKIGFSAHPEFRISTVSRVTGIGLREIARFPGHMLNEHVTHVHARAALIGGEWYDFKQLSQLDKFKWIAKRAMEAASETEAA